MSISIIITPTGVTRSGSTTAIETEHSGQQLPLALQSFAPKLIQMTTSDNHSERIESQMGERHPNPSILLHAWWTARESMWTAQPKKIQSIRKWLKSILPHGKIKAQELRQSLQLSNNADVPSKNWIDKVLNTEITCQLFQGYTHNALTPRRIRERGFICWRHASSEGIRGQDMGPFVEADEYPLDVQLHVLKWAWHNDPPKALRCLQLFAENFLEEVHQVEVQQIVHHPSLSPKQIQKVLGCGLGRQPAHTVQRALYRAQKLSLGGQPIEIVHTLTLAPKKDSAFFLPRQRTVTDLFSKWHQGIQVDQEGRYSLTPERHALRIAKNIAYATVYDAFAGCGGNTIAFAQQEQITTVISNEWDQTRASMCRHNAKIYGGTEQIRFHSHDALEHFPKAPFVFLDPPWSWGHQRIIECWRLFQEHYAHGMLKVPVDFPVPIGCKVKLFSTEKHFPSFLVLIW